MLSLVFQMVLSVVSDNLVCVQLGVKKVFAGFIVAIYVCSSYTWFWMKAKSVSGKRKHITVTLNETNFMISIQKNQ